MASAARRCAITRRSDRRAFLMTLLSAALLHGRGLKADDVDEPAPGVAFKHLVIDPDWSVEAARLRLQIENDSGADVWLVGLRGPDGVRGEILMQQKDKMAVAVDQVLVGDRETLDLASSHLVLTLPNSRAFTGGQIVSVVFEFRGFELPLEAMVR